MGSNTKLPDECMLATAFACCRASYKTKEHFENDWLLDYASIDKYDVTGANAEPFQYIIASNSKTNCTYIAFRGSANIDNWLNNLSVFAALSLDGTEGLVHGGFSSAAVEVSVLEYAQELIDQGQQVVLCGHSLGGAIATLTTVQLLMHTDPKLIERITCITFGAPWVGDTNFANFASVQKWSSRFVHIVNEKDIVPKMLSLSRQTLESLGSNLMQLLSEAMDQLFEGKPVKGAVTTAIKKAVSKLLKSKTVKNLFDLVHPQFAPLGIYYVIAAGNRDTLMETSTNQIAQISIDSDTDFTAIQTHLISNYSQNFKNIFTQKAAERMKPKQIQSLLPTIEFITATEQEETIHLEITGKNLSFVQRNKDEKKGVQVAGVSRTVVSIKSADQLVVSFEKKKSLVPNTMTAHVITAFGSAKRSFNSADIKKQNPYHGTQAKYSEMQLYHLLNHCLLSILLTKNTAQSDILSRALTELETTLLPLIGENTEDNQYAQLFGYIEALSQEDNTSLDVYLTDHKLNQKSYKAILKELMHEQKISEDTLAALPLNSLAAALQTDKTDPNKDVWVTFKSLLPRLWKISFAIHRLNNRISAIHNVSMFVKKVSKGVKIAFIVALVGVALATFGGGLVFATVLHAVLGSVAVGLAGTALGHGISAGVDLISSLFNAESDAMLQVICESMEIPTSDCVVSYQFEKTFYDHYKQYRNQPFHYVSSHWNELFLAPPFHSITEETYQSDIITSLKIYCCLFEIRNHFMQRKNVFVMGPPDSGKSQFLSKFGFASNPAKGVPTESLGVYYKKAATCELYIYDFPGTGDRNEILQKCFNKSIKLLMTSCSANLIVMDANTLRQHQPDVESLIVGVVKDKMESGIPFVICVNQVDTIFEDHWKAQKRPANCEPVCTHVKKLLQQEVQVFIKSLWKTLDQKEKEDKAKKINEREKSETDEIILHGNEDDDIQKWERFCSVKEVVFTVFDPALNEPERWWAGFQTGMKDFVKYPQDILEELEKEITIQQPDVNNNS